MYRMLQRDATEFALLFERDHHRLVCFAIAAVPSRLSPTFISNPSFVLHSLIGGTQSISAVLGHTSWCRYIYTI